jgi:hypothetical protein
VIRLGRAVFSFAVAGVEGSVVRNGGVDKWFGSVGIVKDGDVDGDFGAAAGSDVGC